MLEPPRCQTEDNGLSFFGVLAAQQFGRRDVFRRFDAYAKPGPLPNAKKGDDVANQQQFPARFVYAEQAYHFGAETPPNAGPLYLFTVTWNGEAGTPPGEKLNHDQLLAWMSATEMAGNKVNMVKAPEAKAPEPKVEKPS
jgi:hypothetical protein